jgi:hypothetical protein
MRYHRFKKQIDGTAGIVRRPRNPSTPRKSKVEKSKATKKERGRKNADDDEAERVKAEPRENIKAEMLVKSERGARESSYHHIGAPFTPQSQSPTPSPSQSQHSFTHAIGDMDNMAMSFGTNPSFEDMYSPVMGQNYDAGLSMDGQMGVADPFAWQDPYRPDHRHMGVTGERRVVREDVIPVKRESGWEPYGRPL